MSWKKNVKLLVAVGAINGTTALCATKSSSSDYEFKSQGDAFCEVLKQISSESLVLKGHDKGHQKDHDKDHYKGGW